ncbi:hypothetical protein PENSPDRAFT_283467 [Peniophora sp. CONT]|nr:hypothetical protein PENSPDRAFT_283467 [Peniophora sp. CONT]
MLTAPSTPKKGFLSRLPFFRPRSTSEENEIPALAGGVVGKAADDADLCDLYLAAGIRPPTPLLKSCVVFDGPAPKLDRDVPAPRFNKAKYDAPRGVGLGLRNVKVCPVQPIGWKTWPEEETLLRSGSTDSTESVSVDSAARDSDESSGDESSEDEAEEEKWSLDNVSYENMQIAMRATKLAQRKRVAAGMRARATGWY